MINCTTNIVHPRRWNGYQPKLVTSLYSSPRIKPYESDLPSLASAPDVLADTRMTLAKIASVLPAFLARFPYSYQIVFQDRIMGEATIEETAERAKLSWQGVAYAESVLTQEMRLLDSVGYDVNKLPETPNRNINGEKRSYILRDLTERQRQLYSMVYEDHLRPEGIAKALNISEKQARNNIEILREKVRRAKAAYQSYLKYKDRTY